MRRGLFAAVVALLNVFLGVVPRGSSAGHGNGDKKTGDNGADEEPPDGFCRVIAESEEENERDGNRDEGRYDHLAECRAGYDVNRLVILGLGRAFHDALDLAKLPAYFFHHALRGFPDCTHGNGSEQIRHHAADEKPCDDVGIRQVKKHHAPEGAQLFHVRGKEHEGCEPRRGDGVSFSHGFCGVAHRVQRIRDRAHALRQPRHLGNAACVVRDGAECVNRHDNSREREHGHGSKCYAVEPGRGKCKEHAGRNHDDGERRGFQRVGESDDHGGAVSREGRAGDGLDRTEFLGRVVLGDNRHEAGHGDADDGGEEKAIDEEARQQNSKQRPEAGEREYGRKRQSLVECLHNGAASAHADNEGADDGRDDGDGTHGERQERHGFIPGEEEGTQKHRGNGGDRICFKKIRGHARAVAHVVAHVVRDDRGVARVVFRDAGFYFTDQICTDIRTLGIDASAQARKDRDERGAECQANQRSDARRDIIEERYGKECESHDEESGDGSAEKCRAERLGQAAFRGLGGADIGVHRGHHTEVSGECGRRSAHEKSRGNHAAEEDPEEGCGDQCYGSHGVILALEVCHGPLPDRLPYLHLGAAASRILLDDIHEDQGHDDGCQ